MSLETLPIAVWDCKPSLELQQQAISALEHGKVVFLKDLHFALRDHEYKFLNPDLCGSKKNISYDWSNNQLKFADKTRVNYEGLQELIQRYAVSARTLLTNIFPSYKYAMQGRTSFRPVEIAGRIPKSYRKDDTKLHIDAFPATPMQGKRILRVFSNVNPSASRIWRVGEQFENVVQKFAPLVNQPMPGFAHLLKAFGITRGYRTWYDHYMLHIHDKMKADLQYQRSVPQQEVHFPPGSTWIVYTDQVSHAAMSGQHVFEQTFTIPVSMLQFPEKAPVSVLEKFLIKKLV